MDGKFFETPRFKRDITAIRNNRRRTDKLIRQIVDQCGAPIKSGNQPVFWKDVPYDLISEYVRVYENHPMNMESDGEALEAYIKKNSQFAKWDVLVYSSSNSQERPIEGTDLYVRPAVRPFQMHDHVLSVFGSKMRIGTMGLTKHGLSEKEAEKAAFDYREENRTKYENKYGSAAEEKLKSMSIPDRAYLIQDRNPILIIHYLMPKEKQNLPEEYDFSTDLMVGYGIGFPKLAGSEPKYAVYYVNTVEQRQNFADEIEEDQLDDNDN